MNIGFLEKILGTLSIIYVENNEQYRKSVSEALSMKCKNVYTFSNTKEAFETFIKEHISIIITDINVNKPEDGIEFIKKIRKTNSSIPIIVISTSKDVMQIIQLISLQLIDYIFKPISLRRLRDDLHKSVEVIFNKGTYMIFFDEKIIYNVQQQLLTKNDKEISLTNNERLLLNYLILNQNLISTKESIKVAVWEYSYDITEAAFKSLINRLRTKIGKNSIKNISGSGYMLNV